MADTNKTSTITIDPLDAEIWKVCALCGGNVAKLIDGHDVPEMFCEECKEAVEFAKTILRVGRGKARL